MKCNGIFFGQKSEYSSPDVKLVSLQEDVITTSYKDDNQAEWDEQTINRGRANSSLYQIN